MKILANDGIAPSGVEQLKNAGFTVSTNNIPQDQLIEAINKENYTALLVRSATKVRKELIDACPNLQLIGRGGVGMDNIDVEYARDKGLKVINTPAASSQAVAELVMGQLFALARHTFKSERAMPNSGHSEFKKLKKAYAKGIELRGKTLGIIGFGRIGMATASYALGCGMKILAHDRSNASKNIDLTIADQKISVEIPSSDMEKILSESDFISLHIPAQKDGSYVIDKVSFQKMKSSAFLINAARGGVIDETALLDALNNNEIAGCALDVFENEPTPDTAILSHERIALTPHIGAATIEAQSRIGTELADQIMHHFSTITS